jgi:RND superfamily putative drug exporter
MKQTNWLDQYARAVTGRRSRWVVLGIWIAAVLLMNMLFPQANSLVDNSGENLDPSKPSEQAAILVEQHNIRMRMVFQP